MYVLHTDDSILAGPNKAELDQIIEDIKGTGLDITDEGDIADFLGVNIQREGESFHLTQPKLIDSILEDLHLKEDSHIKDIPMASSKLLSRHKESKDFDHHFNYRRVVGKLSGSHAGNTGAQEAEPQSQFYTNSVPGTRMHMSSGPVQTAGPALQPLNS